MQLLLPARAAHRVLDLTLHVIEGVAQGDVDVFVAHPVDAELVVRQPHVHAHGEGPPLMLMLVRLLGDRRHPVGHVRDDGVSVANRP
jgi:hypothetical protein